MDLDVVVPNTVKAGVGDLVEGPVDEELVAGLDVGEARGELSEDDGLVELGYGLAVVRVVAVFDGVWFTEIDGRSRR